MLSSGEEASLRDSLRFAEQDRWLHLLYRRGSPSITSRSGIVSHGECCMPALDASPVAAALWYRM